MTTYESYAQRYSRSRDHGLQRSSASPSKVTISQKVQQMAPQNTIGNVVAKLADRVDGIQVKITSLANVVKLLQKYTESKDQQYAKQKENLEFKYPLSKQNYQMIGKQGVNPFQSIDSELNNKIRQFESLTRRMKSELSAVQSLRVGMCRQSSQKLFQTSIPQPQNNIERTNEFGENIQDLVENMEDRLRQELNRKIQICMKTFKALSEHHNNHNNQSSTVNHAMLQQQVNHLDLNFNKVEQQNQKHFDFILKKVQQISKHVSKLNTSSFNGNNVKALNESSKNVLHNHERSLTPKSNRSSRSKSKSLKRRNPQSVRVEEKTLMECKRVRQQEVKEAIRRKRQAKQKLKVK